MSLNVKKLFLVLALLGLIGCTPWETGKPIAAGAVSGIQKGKTTQAQVIQMFGTPTVVAIVSKEDEIEYTYRHCLKQSRFEAAEPEICDELFIVFDKSQTVKDLRYIKRIQEGQR